MESRLLAPCCYTQSIAVHGSDIAAQMRSEVAEMVAGGKTEEEIVSHYRNIYGERILIVPDGLTGSYPLQPPAADLRAGFVPVLLCVCGRMLRSAESWLASTVP